jgi:hypothetical protein
LGWKAGWNFTEKSEKFNKENDYICIAGDRPKIAIIRNFQTGALLKGIPHRVSGTN